jgi:ankyrin repeat protein
VVVLALAAVAGAQWETKQFEAGPTCDDSPDQLVRAAARGRTDDVRSLVVDGHDVNARDVYGQIGLYCAVEDGNAAMVRTLLEAGADPNLAQHFDRWPEWDRPLIKSIGDDRHDVTALLVEHGADPNGSSRDRTPLGMAIDHDDLSLATTLLDRGAHPDDLDLGRNPLAVAASNPDDRFANLLLDHGAAVDRHGRSGGACLSLAGSAVGPDCGLPIAGAAMVGNADLVRRLVDLGADPTSGLYPAVQSDRTTIVRELLDRGADPNGRRGTTPLAYAVLFGNQDVVSLLRAAGADPNRGGPADAELLQIGLPLGLDEITAEERERLTTLVCALHGSTDNLPPRVIAAAMGRTEMVRQLLERGADPAITASFDPPVSARSAAQATKNEEIVALLHGDPNETETGGTTTPPRVPCRAREFPKPTVR